MAAVRRRAISSVCASAIALLRVPIFSRLAKPFSIQDARHARERVTAIRQVEAG
jgi:hypothetical protein